MSVVDLPPWSSVPAHTLEAGTISSRLCTLLSYSGNLSQLALQKRRDLSE